MLSSRSADAPASLPEQPPAPPSVQPSRSTHQPLAIADDTTTSARTSATAAPRRRRVVVNYRARNEVIGPRVSDVAANSIQELIASATPPTEVTEVRNAFNQIRVDRNLLPQTELGRTFLAEHGAQFQMTLYGVIFCWMTASRAHAAAALLCQRAVRAISLFCYTLDLRPLCRAIAEAHRRGVRCRVFADYHQTLHGRTINQPDDLDFLLEQGVEVWLVGEEYGRIAMHQKIFLADSMIISGSANWTEASAGNHEFCSLSEAREPTHAAFEDMTARVRGSSVPYTQWHGESGRVSRRRRQLTETYRRANERTSESVGRSGPPPNTDDDAAHAARFSLSRARRAESAAALQRRTEQ